MSSTPSGVVAATAAATVVPLRDGPDGIEVLLLRRGQRGAFAGLWVFPGGRVEAVDALPIPPDPGSPETRADGPSGEAPPAVAAGSGLGVESPGALAVARRAAVREAEEEAALHLHPEDLVALSWWLPPEDAARRFATWFFAAAVRPGADVAVDRAEIAEHRWVRPGDAIDLRQAGTIGLMPPTWMTLHALRHYPDTASALAARRARPPETYVTRGIARDGALRATVWEGDAAYGSADLDAPGPRRRLVLDPAGWRYEGPDVTLPAEPGPGNRRAEPGQGNCGTEDPGHHE